MSAFDHSGIPLPVLHALRKLGQDLNGARRSRRISTTLMAQRMSVARGTLHKMEHGDPKVSMGTYATALFVLGLTDSIKEIADPGRDSIRRSIQDSALPKRIRRRKQNLSK